MLPQWLVAPLDRLDGPGSSAKFYMVRGVTLDANGAIYVNDGNIRKIVIN